MSSASCLNASCSSDRGAYAGLSPLIPTAWSPSSNPQERDPAQMERLLKRRVHTRVCRIRICSP